MNIWKDQRGVTIIELMIVILIAVAISLYAIPRYLESKRAMEIKNATSQVAADLRKTQALAMNGQTSATLTFNPPSSYQITWPDGTVENINLPDNVSIDANPGYVTFNWQGIPSKDLDNDGDLDFFNVDEDVVIKHNSGETITIEIVAHTGEVHVR